MSTVISSRSNAGCANSSTTATTSTPTTTTSSEKTSSTSSLAANSKSKEDVEEHELVTAASVVVVPTNKVFNSNSNNNRSNKACLCSEDTLTARDDQESIHLDYNTYEPVASSSSQQQQQERQAPSPNRPNNAVSIERVESIESLDSEESSPLVCLENVTAQSRSLIARDFHSLVVLEGEEFTFKNKKKSNKHFKKKTRFWKPPNNNMATPDVSSNNNSTTTTTTNGGGGGEKKKNIFMRGLSMRRPKEDEIGILSTQGSSTENVPPPASSSSSSSAVEQTSSSSSRTGRDSERKTVLQRLRSVSRSRKSDASSEEGANKPILVAVTSCRSDAYYNQKAPGSTFKLPRKAPSNLKLFHELAVGIKDAYAAVGQTPEKPSDDQPSVDGKMVLWEFIGNLDFLLALVDEVAIDTATRGALKDDSTFKSLRDVIKKCNKVLEGMLVRRERRYTLFFRIVQPTESKDIAKIKSWNIKVEKAIGSVTDTPQGHQVPDSDSEDASIKSDTSSRSGRGSIVQRGRQLLPSAGRVRARRATPTPTLRNRRPQDSISSAAADDGFAASTPATNKSLNSIQNDDVEGPKVGGIPALMPAPPPNAPQLSGAAPIKPMEPKDELIDVIRGLRTEKIQKREGSSDSDLAALKPNWQPKADIPSSVPQLPTEYIHRHRLMKQVVNCLLDLNGGGGGRDANGQTPNSSIITSITSRHADKPGNGKTTLAVASIQTVEVRERFCDGIAWIQLGRNPLTEKEVRRLYEELFKQLVSKDEDDADDDDAVEEGNVGEEEKNENGGKSLSSRFRKTEGLVETENAIRLAESRQRFQGGELEAIKEDLANIITKRKILICLDDVWRVDDAKWFIFDTHSTGNGPKASLNDTAACPYRILITSRTPALLGPGVVQEVFVRIFSEHEAVKLLLSSAGRRPYGGKQSAVFNQARVIVKGCGNSPMAVRLAGGMLRRSNRNWNLSSPTWTSLIQQSKLNLEEASRLRSFVNSVTRVVDLGFAAVDDMELRVALRRCFIMFAVTFRINDWVHIGKGIPRAVILKLFEASIAAKSYTADEVLTALETMNLLERARHGTTSQAMMYRNKDPDSDDDDDFGDDVEDTRPTKSTFLENPSYVMQDALRVIGEDLARREEPAFLPESDDFTSFDNEIKEERKYHDAQRGPLGGAIRFISKRLTTENGEEVGLAEAGAHEIMIGCLIGVSGRVKSSAAVEAFRKSKDLHKSDKRSDKIEEYMAVFLPSHFVRSQNYAAAGELLTDLQFIRRRVTCLGAAEATRKHVVDLLELRREVAKEPGNSKSTSQSPAKNRLKAGQSADEGDKGSLSQKSSTDSTDVPDGEEPESVDASLVLRDGCRTMVDEVHRVVSNSKGSAESLSMAICLSTVGEALMKGKQPRDALLRLEEAVIIYRSLLGEKHVDVARSLHSVARALVKLGEHRVALHKFIEAAEIYERCNASMHYDSIANSQNLATLLIDLGEWEKAGQYFKDVINKKTGVYGPGSVSVAKTINSYAILLAKHGRMNEALFHYESAKSTYEAVPPSLLQDAEFEIKCKYDVTLINLNIASIKSKKGDLQGAIKSYAEGVRGLREYEASQEKLMAVSGEADDTKNTSHVKHLVAALGRIGSLKLKVGDNLGALEAYLALLVEVDTFSPHASKVEAAKAHIKCATIYRQEDSANAHQKSISHLREALEMYTVLFGPEHKDTLAIASSLRQWLGEEAH